MTETIGLPAVLGGTPTWAPVGEVSWTLWGGTGPTWDVELNRDAPDAVLWPVRRPEDAAAVAQAAEGSWAFNGPTEQEAAEALAARAGVAHLALVSSGTSALGVLYSAVMARSWLRGGAAVGVPEVIMTAETFHATASMAAACGLRPVLIDVAPDTGVPTTEAVRRAITETTVGIVAVAMFATISALDEWRALADDHGLWLVVDGAHAPFGRYLGRPFGDWADGVTMSFQRGKVLTCGEGGAVATRDPLVAALTRMAIVGKVPDPLPSWWPHDELDRIQRRTGARAGGLMAANVRITEWQAAVLLSQLDLQDEQQAHREHQIQRLAHELATLDLPFDLLAVSAPGDGISYKVGIYNRTAVPTEHLRHALRRQVTGECTAPYPPLSVPESGLLLDTQPWQFGHLGWRADPADHPDAMRAWRELLMLSHDFFLREHAAEQLIHALTTLAAHEAALADWARASPLSDGSRATVAAG